MRTRDRQIHITVTWMDCWCLIPSWPEMDLLWLSQCIAAFLWEPCRRSKSCKFCQKQKKKAESEQKTVQKEFWWAWTSMLGVWQWVLRWVQVAVVGPCCWSELFVAFLRLMRGACCSCCSGTEEYRQNCLERRGAGVFAWWTLQVRMEVNYQGPGWNLAFSCRPPAGLFQGPKLPER